MHLQGLAERKMQNYIESVNLNILDVLKGKMEFLPGLNLISGENGTLKTKLLHSLKSVNGIVTKVPQAPLRIQAISPKRNSERRAADSIIQTIRQQSRTFDAAMSERLNAQINDATFENYSSFSDLYYLVFEQRTKDGGARDDHMKAITKEFNKVINAIFENYKLVSAWNNVTGAPSISIQKGNANPFPIEGLSLGEQEILSLVANLYTAKDQVDVFIIDEPEVHLNWHLENRLFQFLNDLCMDYSKQAIVVSHSRAIFKQQLLSKTQFLYWGKDKQVHWGKTLSKDKYKRIAGEAIEIIRMGDSTKPTFYVEDKSHTLFLNCLSETLSLQIVISECNNSPNVKSLFNQSKKEGHWQNSFFLIDGDNQGNPFPSEPNFIHLPVYCSENYLLNPKILAEVFGKSELEIRQLILDAIKKKRTKILEKNRFSEFLIDLLEEHHITYERLCKLDASEIVDEVANKLDVTVRELTGKTLEYIFRKKIEKEMLPSKLLEVIATLSSQT